MDGLLMYRLYQLYEEKKHLWFLFCGHLYCEPNNFSIQNLKIMRIWIYFSICDIIYSLDKSLHKIAFTITSVWYIPLWTNNIYERYNTHLSADRYKISHPEPVKSFLKN